MKNTRLYFLSLLVGLFAGLAGATFRWCLNEMIFVRQFMFAHQQTILFHGSILLSMLLLAMIIYWLTQKVPLISGSGIPQSRGVIFGRFKFTKPWLQFFTKYFGSVGAIGMGMSLGREGPSVMMGALGGSLTSNIFKVNPTERRYLISAGAGAGLSAAFTAPIASTIFLLEDTLGWVSFRIVVPALLACIVAGYCAQLILPINPYLEVPIVVPHVDLWILFIMLFGLAIFACLGGKLFNLTLFHCKKWYSEINANPWIKIGVVVVITYISGMLVFDLVSGGETELIKQALSNGGNVWWLFAIVLIKIALTCICYSTGLCGSLLLPLVVLGGLTGKCFALLLIQFGAIDVVSTGYFTLIGMATYFVAVVRAPISGMMLILEMTGRYEIFFPLIVTGTITFVLGNYINAIPVYHTLYNIMIKDEKCNPDNVLSTSFRVNKDSYWEGKNISELDLPHDTKIADINGVATTSSTSSVLENGDLVKVDIREKDYEKLFKVFRSLSNE